MLAKKQEDVQRVLIIHLGSSEEVLLTNPTLRTRNQSLPDTTITLLATPALSQLALQLSLVDDVLMCESAGLTFLNPECELAMIQTLRNRAFDVAFIFTNVGESPYPLAYICYLAGIPIRLGQSQEFGGSVLSEWVKLTGNTQI